MSKRRLGAGAGLGRGRPRGGPRTLPQAMATHRSRRSPPLPIDGASGAQAARGRVRGRRSLGGHASRVWCAALAQKRETRLPVAGRRHHLGRLGEGSSGRPGGECTPRPIRAARRDTARRAAGGTSRGAPTRQGVRRGAAAGATARRPPARRRVRSRPA